AQPGRPDPTRHGSPPAGEDRPEEQPHESSGRTGIEGGGQSGKPVARGGGQVRGWHGRLRPGSGAGVVTAIVPDGPALVYLPPVSGSNTGSRGKNSLQVIPSD